MILEYDFLWTTVKCDQPGTEIINQVLESGALRPFREVNNNNNNNIVDFDIQQTSHLSGFRFLGSGFPICRWISIFRQLDFVDFVDFVNFDF